MPPAAGAERSAKHQPIGPTGARSPDRSLRERLPVSRQQDRISNAPVVAALTSNHRLAGVLCRRTQTALDDLRCLLISKAVVNLLVTNSSVCNRQRDARSR